MRRLRGALVPVLVTVFVTVACGGGGDVLSASDCVETAVAQYNSLDLAGVNIADGVDDDEEIGLRAQVRAIQDQHPELVPFATCDGVLSLEDRLAINSRLRPEVVQVFIASELLLPPPPTAPTAPAG
ncbi:MAG: hypothetical protein ACT4PW_02550 [Acidimicrobiia bacterium]